MASKYDPLARYLERQSGPRHTMSFAEIEKVTGLRLPPSSRPPAIGWRQWWENSHSPRSSHTQARCGWIAAGWEVDSVDPIQQTITFRK